MVYEKSLSLSTSATTGGDMTAGQIANHMSTDPMNLLYMFQFFHFSWTVPFLVTVIRDNLQTTYVLCKQVVGKADKPAG